MNEQDTPVYVRDDRADKGISLSNIIQALLLASTVGFGTMIVNAVNDLTAQVGLLNTNTTLNTNNITRNTVDIVDLRRQLYDHIKPLVREE